MTHRRMGILWHELQVLPRFERIVEVDLERKGYEVFAPKYALRRGVSPELSLSLPLFPGRVFCRFDAHSKVHVLLTPGVIRIAGVGQTPSGDSEINTLRRLLTVGLSVRPAGHMPEGDETYFASGALKGIAGFVVRTADQNRVTFSVPLKMGAVSVEIERDWIGREYRIVRDKSIAPWRTILGPAEPSG